MLETGWVLGSLYGFEADAVWGAFIFYYTKMHGVAPAELDMQRYFRVTPPSVHDMVLRLEADGFIERVPGKGRSIRLLIPREELPDLE